MCEPKHEPRSWEGGYQCKKNVRNEQGNWSMNEINLICGNSYFLRITFLFFTWYDLGCVHSQ